MTGDGDYPEDIADTDAPEPGKFDQWVDLARMIGEPRPRPSTLANVVYPRRTHALTGEPESGKSTIGLWLLLQAMALGYPVMLIDSEAGVHHTADMLQAFGADPDMIKRLLTYVCEPRVRWHDRDIGELHDKLAKTEPKIVMFDSMARMLAAADLNENDAAHVTRIWDRVLDPIARDLGSSVIVTDHDSKDGLASRYGRGSTAKLAAVDVQIKVAAIQPFSRDQDGVLEVLVTKDRPGCLHRSWRINVTRDPLALAWTRNDAKAGSPIPGMAPGKAKILAGLTEEPSPIRDVIDRMAAIHGHGLKRPTASSFLNELVDEGYADRIDQGQFQDALWCLHAETRPPSPGPQQDAIPGVGLDDSA